MQLGRTGSAGPRPPSLIHAPTLTPTLLAGCLCSFGVIAYELMHRKMIIADLMSTGSAEEAEGFAYKVCMADRPTACVACLTAHLPACGACLAVTHRCVLLLLLPRCSPWCGQVNGRDGVGCRNVQNVLCPKGD